MILRSLTLFAVLMLPTAAVAENFLMYGPSLATEIEEAARTTAPTQGAVRSGSKEDESDFATEAGHTVTIVDADEWLSMTTEQFASYDAIVFGDADCGDDDGALLEPVNDSKAVWSPAVTGHLFVHTFDNVLHHPENDPEQEANQVALAVDGMVFAASANGTGLYYSNGCRSFDAGSRGGLFTLDFLSELVDLSLNDDSWDDISIVQPLHPAMLNLSDAGLSGWGSSAHADFFSYPESLQVLAVGFEDPEERGAEFPTILASIQPLGGADSVLDVPTASGLGLFGLVAALGVLGVLVLLRNQ